MATNDSVLAKIEISDISIHQFSERVADNSKQVAGDQEIKQKYLHISDRSDLKLSTWIPELRNDSVKKLDVFNSKIIN